MVTDTKQIGEALPRDVPLAVGQRLVARYKGTAYEADVVEAGAPGEGIGIRVGGVTYKSLSVAGTAVTSGSVNGWKFWRLAGGDAPAAPAKRRGRPPKAKAEEPESDGADCSGLGEDPEVTEAQRALEAAAERGGFTGPIAVDSGA